MDGCHRSGNPTPPATTGCFGDGTNAQSKSAGAAAVAAAAATTSDESGRGRCETSVMDEIQQLSDGVRRALECPVCKELSGAMSTCCDNGHGLCDECSCTMNRLHPQKSPKCPLCRSPPARPEEDACSPLMPLLPPPPPPGSYPEQLTYAWPPVPAIHTQPKPASTRKLHEFMSVVKVTCAYRPNGCPHLVYVLQAAAHETLCPHAPHVRCMVPYCQWSGPYGGVFHHVATEHQFSAYDVLENQFLMPDLSFGLHGTMRRAYLTRNIRDGDRLYWVCVARPTVAGIQVAVLKVFDPDAPAKHEDGPPDMVFRVRTKGLQGYPRQRGRPRSVCWDRMVLDRMSRSMAGGEHRDKLMNAIHTPPWCTATVPNDMQFEAAITWSSVAR